MELLYNPERMPEHAVKETFVARHDIVDGLVSLIEHQPQGAGVQHAVMIAPRGMGKTTLLLMVRFAIRDSKLAKQWQTLQFPEERYNIYDLADFWIEILTHLDELTDGNELQQQIEKLKAEYPNKDELQEVAFALIKDWGRKNKKRILVLVDNFDMILEQINDERDNARLRDVLMNDGTVMLIGAATTFFHEARAYDQPLYNFFKIYELPNLKFEQMQDLLRRRAALDKREDFEKTLKENKSRLRVLEHFTGGNPRLVLMLYRVVTQSDISQVRLGLEKLLDEVTPYYKSKVESLPPQQRKILDHIARISSQTNEGLTPGEIAIATRMSPNQASAQLKRLVEHGYVQAANLRGRSSYYTLSERLYAIWHQMRFGRTARERMGWLISILKALYDAQEMRTQSELLATRFDEFIVAGQVGRARDTLEHHRYLVEAMDDSAIRSHAIEGIVMGHLELNDFEILKQEILPVITPGKLSLETLERLKNAGCLDDQYFASHDVVNRKLRAKEISDYVTQCLSEEDFEHVLPIVEILIKGSQKNPEVWFLHGMALGGMNRLEEAILSFERAVKLNPRYINAWQRLGQASFDLGKFERALESLDRVLEINPKLSAAWAARGVVLMKLSKNKESLDSIYRALEIDPQFVDAIYLCGVLHFHAERYDEALVYFDKVLQIDTNQHDAWSALGSLYILRFLEYVNTADFKSARAAWDVAIDSFKQSGTDEWKNIALAALTEGVLLDSSGSTHLQFVRQLIEESELSQELFALARAIDYFQTSDEALLERLSPEVRGVVEEIENQLRQSGSQLAQHQNKSKRKKPKSGAHRRLTKQLR